MRSSIRTSLILAVTLLSLAVPSADAVNITGTWVGTLICDLVVPENPHFRQVLRDQVVEIEMLNNWQFLLEFQDGANASDPMFGSAVDDGRIQTRGKVAAQACPGQPGHNPVPHRGRHRQRHHRRRYPQRQMTRLLTNAPGFVETCRVAFRRTSTAVPTIDSSCP